MPGRLLTAVACLSAAVGVLLGLVMTGAPSPEPVIVAPMPHERVAAIPAADTPAPHAVPSFADIAQRLNPAVVNIDATSRAASAPGLFEDDPLSQPEPLGPQPFGRDPERYRRGAGAGFLIDADGHILTCQHVVAGATRLTVRLVDGRRFRATRVGSDPDTDIALLKVEAAEPLPFVPLGDSDRLRVGEWVAAIGNPWTYEHTVTVGVVSFVGRKLFNSSLDRYIQTDAAISLGNSGGPLINASGEVVGINSAVSRQAPSIGFAVPINQAVAILPQLREHGRVSRGYIGLDIRDVDPDLREALGLPAGTGALVQDVMAGSPGERAGIRPYDLIVGVDGEKIEDNDQLIRLISARRPGSRADLHVLRDSRPVTVAVKLSERSVAEPGPLSPDPVEPAAPPAGPAVGMSVREIDDETAARAKLPPDVEGLIVSRVDPVGPASDARIERGYVLLEINRRPVRSMDDYRTLLAGTQPGDVLALYLYDPELLRRTLHTLRLDR